MKTKFFCMSCKKPVESEILEVREKSGRKYALSECPICQSNMSVVLPKDFKVNPAPYEEPVRDDPKLNELKEKVKEREEYIKVQDFKENVNQNPLLREHGVIAVNISEHMFYKFFTFFIFLLILTGLIVVGWMIANGKLDGLVKPVFNNQVDNNVQNSYNFSPETNNQYTHKIDNNFTINIINYINGSG